MPVRQPGIIWVNVVTTKYGAIHPCVYRGRSMKTKSRHNAKLFLMGTTQNDVMAWKRLPYHWPFVRGIDRWPVVTGGFPSQRVIYAVFWLFLWCCLEQATERTINLPLIWDAMSLKWRHYNGLSCGIPSIPGAFPIMCPSVCPGVTSVLTRDWTRGFLTADTERVLSAARL